MSVLLHDSFFSWYIDFSFLLFWPIRKIIFKNDENSNQSANDDAENGLNVWRMHRRFSADDGKCVSSVNIHMLHKSLSHHLFTCEVMRL